MGGPGAWSSISDVRNNVHWLTAKTDDAFLFTTKLIELDDDKIFHGRVNIDVHAATRGAGGLLRARRFRTSAAELYG